MAYIFNTNVPDPSISSSELTIRTDRWANASTTELDDSFWKDGSLMEQQLMSSDSLDGLLAAINRANSSTLNLVLHLAIGTQLRFRPWISLEGGSTFWRFELESGDPDIPANTGRSPINPTGPISASAFVANFDSTNKENLYSLFEYTDSSNQVQRVKTYTYSASDVSDLFSKAMDSAYGKVKLYLFFGAGSEQAGDAGVSHPMDFRPVLDLKVTNDDESTTASYWDFSQPCPPNCGSGN